MNRQSYYIAEVAKLDELVRELWLSSEPRWDLPVRVVNDERKCGMTFYKFRIAFQILGGELGHHFVPHPDLSILAAGLVDMVRAWEESLVEETRGPTGVGYITNNEVPHISAGYGASHCSSGGYNDFALMHGFGIESSALIPEYRGKPYEWGIEHSQEVSPGIGEEFSYEKSVRNQPGGDLVNREIEGVVTDWGLSMGDRYVLTLTCPGCGAVDDEVYYAPTCGFVEHRCPVCGRVTDLGELTGVTYGDASNLAEMERLEGM